jgi:hypothetical protein
MNLLDLVANPCCGKQDDDDLATSFQEALDDSVAHLVVGQGDPGQDETGQGHNCGPGQGVKLDATREKRHVHS